MQDKLKKIDPRKIIPAMVIFTIALMYGLGVKSYKQEVGDMIALKEKLTQEVQDLRLKSQKEQEVMATFVKIQSALTPEREVVKKVLIFYPPESISYSDNYFLIEPLKVTSTLDSTKQTEDLTSQSIINTLVEVKKCRQIFQSSCVIQQLYPLQLKVYFLP